MAAQTRELNAFFEGGPVRRLREQFIALGKEGEDAIEELKAHLMRLSEIAAIYERAERSNTDVSAADECILCYCSHPTGAPVTVSSPF